MEIHLIIYSYLPTSAIAILSLVPGIRNIYSLGKPLEWTPVELGYARELITRADMERIITPHIREKTGFFDPSSLDPEEIDRLLKCRLLCMACGEDYPLTHFSVEQVAMGIKRQGHAKMLERKCLGSCRQVRVHRGKRGNLTWEMLEEVRQDLLRKAESVSAYGDDIAETALSMSLLNLPPPRPDQNRRLMLNLRSVLPNPTDAKRSEYGMGIFFPEPYIRLHAQPYPASSSRFVFYAHTQSHTLLTTKWSGCLSTNLFRLRTAFICKDIKMCPHMTELGYLSHPDMPDHIEGSMLRYLVKGLHSKDQVWEDVLFENGDATKRVKRMASECSLCYKGGCQTEVVLERVRYRVRKGQSNATGTGSGVSGISGDRKKSGFLSLGLPSRKDEKWKEFVIATVNRHWMVDTPSGKQWRLQAELKGAKKNGGWGI
jgi:hypothetical protein